MIDSYNFSAVIALPNMENIRVSHPVFNDLLEFLHRFVGEQANMNCIYFHNSNLLEHL